MNHIIQLAEANRRAAREVLRDTHAEETWRAAGAIPHLVGSLRSGLLMKHLDIDLHIYSPTLQLETGFEAMARIAENPRIRHIEYTNLLDAEDRCIEWHARYTASDGREWQIDMIHMEAGSPWEGYFEQVADRIAAALTEETRNAILRLKYETPETMKIAGIRYCQAVLRDGVRTSEEFARWCAAHPDDGGIIDWMP